MKVEELLATACKQTGLTDFGDPSFREGLEVLVAALENEAQLNDIGRATAETMIRSGLANRLRVENWWSRHPELIGEQIERPFFIVGMSRSGTTALSHLLARDPRNRSLLQWEASDSVPPPEAATYETDPRYQAARQADGALHALNPGFKAIHYDPPDLPVECLVVMAQHYVSLHLPTMFNVPSYTAWVLQQDHAPVYHWHARVLRLLQSRKPGRWQLKSPHHAIALETIAATYPDACFLITHRDPTVCVVSTASLVRSLSGTFSDGDWSTYIGRQWSEILGTMAERAMAFHERYGHRLIDVPYEALVADPVGSVRRVYAELGEELTAEAESAMRAHAKERTQHRYGRHTYSFKDFGLDPGELDELFAAYRERFDVAREARGDR